MAVAVLLSACAGGAASYPQRPSGCPVRTFPAEPTISVDEIGPVTVECEPGRRSCDRQLLDRVCALGGDVAWGLADNPLTATHLTAHAAHSHEQPIPPGGRGCVVQVFSEAPTEPTRNIGPVTAWCDESLTQQECLRELEDQVCFLGGDILWQVDGPTESDGKQRMFGRAAHTRH